jgi:hypothetical protein
MSIFLFGKESTLDDSKVEQPNEKMAIIFKKIENFINYSSN